MRKILVLLSLFIIIFPCMALADGATAEYGYVDGNTIYAGISLDNPMADSSVYAGIYTSDGKLKGIKSYPVTDTSYSIDMEISGYSSHEGDVLRMFYLGKDIAPLAETVNHSMNSIRLSGIITGTSIIGGAVSADEVEFSCTDAYGNPEWEKIISEMPYGTVLMHSIPNINDYFGACVNVYAEPVTGGIYKITDISYDENYSIVILENGDIDDISSTELRYYENYQASQTTNLKLDNSIAFYYNNEETNLSNWNRWGADAEIKVIENNGDGKYDLIVAKEYNYGIIDTVDASEGRFTLEDITGTFSFDFEDPYVSNVILDIYGNAITLDDFEEGDVIAYVSESNRRVGFEWIEIINLAGNCVSGMVTELNTNTSTVFIDDIEYGITDSILYNIKVFDEGIFYLTKSDKIFHVKSLPLNYGYVLDAGQSASAFSQTWQVKMLAKDGSVEIYDLDFNLTYTGSSGDTGSGMATSSSSDEITEFLESLAVAEFNESADKRVVSYKLNSNDVIVSLSLLNGEEFTERKYYQDYSSLGTTTLDSAAVVFNVSGNDIDDAYANNLSCLIDKNIYSGYAYTNSDGDYDCIVITDGVCDYEKPEIEHTYSQPMYGYAYASAYSDIAFQNVWQIKIIGESYPETLFSFCDTFEIDGVVYTSDDYSIADLDKLNEPDCSGSQRLVSYVLMDGTYIKELNFVSAESFEYAVYSGGYLDDTVLSDGVRIFDIDSEEEIDGNLVENELYSGYAIRDENGVYTSLFITYGYYEESDSPNTEYAYVFAFGETSGFSGCSQLQVMNSDGDTVIYDLAERYYVNGLPNNGFSAGELQSILGIESDDVKEYASSRIVEISLNSNMEITSINSMECIDAFSGNYVKYNENTNTLGNSYLSDSFIIFDVSRYDYGSAYVTDYTSLTHGSFYRGYLVKNEIGDIDVFVISDFNSISALVNYGQNISVVDSVESIIYNDDDAWNVRYYTGGSDIVQSLTVTPDTIPGCTSDSIETVVSSMDKGDIFMFSKTVGGTASALVLISDAQSGTDPEDAAYVLNPSAVSLINMNDDFEVVADYIDSYKTGSNASSLICGESQSIIAINNTSCCYTYDNRTQSNISVIAGDWLGTDTIDFKDDGLVTYFVAFIKNGIVSDIVTYSTRRLINSDNMQSNAVIDYHQDITVVDEVKSITENTEDAFKVKYYTNGDDTSMEVSVVYESAVDNGNIITLPETTSGKKAVVIE